MSAASVHWAKVYVGGTVTELCVLCALWACVQCVCVWVVSLCTECVWVVSLCTVCVSCEPVCTYTCWLLLLSCLHLLVTRYHTAWQHTQYHDIHVLYPSLRPYNCLTMWSLLPTTWFLPNSFLLLISFIFYSLFSSLCLSSQAGLEPHDRGGVWLKGCEYLQQVSEATSVGHSWTGAFPFSHS